MTSKILLIIFLILQGSTFTTLSFVAQTDSDDEGILIRANWRAGEVMRYEFSEHVSLTDNGELTSERTHHTFVLVEVAARRGNEGYILLWRVLNSDASLFNDSTLDDHMFGLLADGIVIHTDVFGGFSHTSNMDYFWTQFRNAVDILDQAEHWSERYEVRDYIQYYMDYKDAFETLLIRDMTFLFGMHGVLADLKEVYEYETWQLNPWGEPAQSKGELETISYNRETGVIEFVNTVHARINEPVTADLFERQHFFINTISGWPLEVRLEDRIHTDGFIRQRDVEIRQVIY